MKIYTLEMLFFAGNSSMVSNKEYDIKNIKCIKKRIQFVLQKNFNRIGDGKKNNG